MIFFGTTSFHIRGLNQEIVLWELSKICPIFEIDRKSKKETFFSCAYRDRKKVKKFLFGSGVEIVSAHDCGFLPDIVSLTKNYGLLLAVVCFAVFFIIVNQFVFIYEINGLENISKSDVVVFLKENFSSSKNKLSCDEIEHSLSKNFEKISFVSCAIKGQTLIVNIKEKLNPNSIYGDFLPIVSNKNCRITQIDLISGTAKVKVGDFVKEGDILIEPYAIDTSGNVKNVEAKATISAQVYNEGFSQHYDCFWETYQTGNVFVKDEVRLFGLSLYVSNGQIPFSNYQTKVEEIVLTKNNILPFKLYKTYYFETSQRLVKIDFDDVKDYVIENAKTKALENCDECDKIIEEYHTIKSMAGVTVVRYCVVSMQNIGVYNDS